MTGKNEETMETTRFCCIVVCGETEIAAVKFNPYEPTVLIQDANEIENPPLDLPLVRSIKELQLNLDDVIGEIETPPKTQQRATATAEELAMKNSDFNEREVHGEKIVDIPPEKRFERKTDSISGHYSFEVIEASESEVNALIENTDSNTGE